MCRTLLLPVLLLLSSLSAVAQPELGGFFSAAGAWTRINGSGTVMPSAGAGVILDRRFVLGASLYALIPTIEADSLNSAGRPLYITLFGWQGRLEYIHNPEDFFQYGGGVLLGGGTLGFETGSADHTSHEDTPHYFCFFLEPEIGLSLAFNEQFRLRGSFGWRVVAGRESGSEPAGELSGPAATFGFRVGWFGSRGTEAEH